MDLGLKGLRALVTGGTKGIGRRCADILADEGASVSVCARDAAGVEAAVAALKGKGVAAFGSALDVADKAALEAWVVASAEALGGIDIVIGNVSALAVGDDEESWAKEFATDMMHSVRLVNAAMPWLEKSKAPSITLISSVSGREVDFTGPGYAVMKTAVVRYAQDLAFKLAPKMIRANTVSPGNTYFDGGIWQTIEKGMPELFASTLKANPTGKFGTPAEVANAVVFLSSPAASRISGTNLVVDGALTVAV